MSALAKYIVCGIICVILDYSLYISLLSLGSDIYIAKSISMFISIMIGYVMSSSVVFNVKKTNKNFIKYWVVYTLSAIQNIITNGIFAMALPSYLFPIQTAFLIATAISVFINFLGMKFWVFKQ